MSVVNIRQSLPTRNMLQGCFYPLALKSQARLALQSHADLKQYFWTKKRSWKRQLEAEFWSSGRKAPVSAFGVDTIIKLLCPPPLRWRRMEIEMEEGNKSRVLPAALGTLIPSLKECRKRVLQCDDTEPLQRLASFMRSTNQYLLLALRWSAGGIVGLKVIAKCQEVSPII